MALAVLTLVGRLGYEQSAARAATFHFMAIGQLLMTYPSRVSATRPLPNRALHVAVAFGIVLQVLVAGVPGVSAVFGDVTLPLALWTLVFGGAGLSWALSAGLARWLWRA